MLFEGCKLRERFEFKPKKATSRYNKWTGRKEGLPCKCQRIVQSNWKSSQFLQSLEKELKLNL